MPLSEATTPPAPHWPISYSRLRSAKAAPPVWDWDI